MRPSGMTLTEEMKQIGALIRTITDDNIRENWTHDFEELWDDMGREYNLTEWRSVCNAEPF